VKPQGQQEQWWSVFSTRRRHWRRVGSCTAARKPRQAGVSHNFFPSSRPRRCDLQNTQKHNRQSILLFLSFVFRSASLSLLLYFGSTSLYRSVLFFFFPILLCFRWRQDQGGRRLLGFYRVWPAKMEKRSVVACDRWSCCGDERGCWRC